MPTRDQVLAALDGGTDYPAAARRLGIHPGLAYLIATGFPADGSDVVTEAENRRPGVLPGSSQHLANPRLHEPDASSVVHPWLRRRAGADPQMVAAARARTATPGPVNDPGATADVVTVLTRQHDAVVSLVKQLSAIPGASTGGTPAQASERESIVDMISMALASHETAEEEHLWPAVRRVLPDGDDWAERGIAQEQQATETFLALSRADPQSEEFDDLVEEVTSQLHKHVAHEDQVFLRLRDALSDDERAELGRRVLDAQVHAPTRPHPHAPRRPGPVVAAAATSAVPLDEARDATGRPADRAGHPDPETEQ
ncbi:hemerythrin domain-containing protein [Blastococcus tunisiensis]|uniref:Hemerythrin HHE cation binding domain-containing protein n=1 Tax=Blastococcus tunisiensis TaxID=1798228 RepID=A0A1I2DSW2_9ACTN|nr:hemerythrin domain-containing protein [Blastococcus sp. DSM 46838]SFE83774.1 Hemerythrin HHE cation binding domain-containing protein [Blastococcus sp. DSM 46838]